jgi:SAM-dependent MidA family methyltransferase
VDLRRVPPPDLDVPSDRDLLERIREEIRSAGPMTFARFMELALYDDTAGYYRRPNSGGPGRGGDFLTAPETHPIFGRALARFVADLRVALGRPVPFVIREFGPGSGALAVALLDGLAEGAPEAATAVRYRVADIEPRRAVAVHERLTGAGHGDALEEDDGAPIDGLVISNEVLDALPTHRVVSRGSDLREVFVDVDPTSGALVNVEGPPSTPALATRLAGEGIRLADGQRAEVCLGVDDWVARAAAGLRRGILLLIDYGHPAVELYDPRHRRDGTLAAYLHHAVHDDPYRAIGLQDLTAHVDVTAVERAAAAAGLDHLATVTQTRFLEGLGIGDLLVGLQTAPGATLQGYLEARSAVVRLIDPAAMGRFRVMAFGRGVAPGVSLRGLAEASPLR